MSRPWQIWSLYFLGLAGVAGAFGWLTAKALELDRAEAVARRQAELEEDVSRALWRMDSLLTPLLAEEAARPQFVYRPTYATAASLPTQPNELGLSPLLADPPQYVLLHFELYPDGRLTSPQCPTGEEIVWALKHGASADQIRAAATRLESLKPALTHSLLLEQLPNQSLSLDFSADGYLPPVSGADQPANSPVISNTYENLGRWFSSPKSDSYAMPAGPSQPGTSIANPSQQPAEPAPESERLAQQQAGQAAQPLDETQLGYGANVESGRLQRSQSRAGNDLANREAALQAYAQKSAVEQRSNYKDAAPPSRVVEGVSRPLWVNDRLLVARRVQIDGQTVVQGCWLNWDLLKNRLRAEVADLLPSVELLPLAAAAPIKLSRLLASVPVQIFAPPPAPPPVAWSPIRVSLVIAWGCVMITALAAAITLSSVMTLSERRGAFVAAVTHELRTPLTTFRMYAEMLAAGMVPDAAQRQQYLETLRTEADRLAHLVENVLQYARLERGRPGKRREPISLASLLDRCQSRLLDRATQTGMQFGVEITDADREISIATDAAAIEQILFNLVDNACKYAAEATDRGIQLAVQTELRRVRITVRDHGPGISASGRRRLFQPFSKSVNEAANTAPGVGLGLALSRRLAAELGGKLELDSPAGGGAAFVLTLPR